MTGWAIDDAVNASHLCFEAWLEQRGGNAEKIQAVESVKEFIQEHGESRFFSLLGISDVHEDLSSKTSNRVGYRIEDKTEDNIEVKLAVFPNQFYKLCGGLDPSFVVRVLADKGFLEYEVFQNEKRLQKRIRINGTRHRMYIIKPTILE